MQTEAFELGHVCLVMLGVVWGSRVWEWVAHMRLLCGWWGEWAGDREESRSEWGTRVLREVTWPLTPVRMPLFSTNAPSLILGSCGLLKPLNGP